jgi:hypothetical protein
MGAFPRNLFPMDDLQRVRNPNVVKAMQQAIDYAVSKLPQPASSNHLRLIAEAILRFANEGERNPVVTEKMGRAPNYSSKITSWRPSTYAQTFGRHRRQYGQYRASV